MPDVQFSEPQTDDRPVPTREDIARTWGAQQLSAKPGRSARKRQDQVRNLVRRLQAETRRESDGKIIGPLRPCTVVNFNPIGLVVEGQLRITIPKPGTTAHHQIKMPYKGRMVQGHYCYIASPMVGDTRKPDKEPIYYTVTTGHEVDSILPIDVPTVAARVFSPHSIACELWSQYNSPSHKLMGGILMFDQGPHMLSPASLARQEGYIEVPERRQMEDEGMYTYALRRITLEEELDQIFSAQREYCDIVLQQAHTLWAEQDVTSRKMVTDTHREWARFAKAMGYLGTLPEWVNARLDLGDKVNDLRTCAYCGTQQSNAMVFFCPKCNAPYDAFKAFQAGLHVAEGYLMTLDGEELEIVLRTIETRKARFAGAPAPVPVPTIAALPPEVAAKLKAPKAKPAKEPEPKATEAPSEEEGQK